MKMLLKRLLLSFLRVFPLRRTILVESGDNPFDNGFVLMNHLASSENFRRFRIVFIGKLPKEHYDFLPRRARYYRFVPKGRPSLRFLSLSMRAKYIFYTYDNLWAFLPLSKNTKIIFLQHGAFPIKSVDRYFSSMFNNANHYHCLCTTEFTQNVFRRIFPEPNVKYFLAPFPRFDLLGRRSREEIFQALQLPLDAKILLVMTTFRKFHDESAVFFRDEFSVNLSEDELQELNEKLRREGRYVIFKLHHAQKCDVDEKRFTQFRFYKNDALEKMNLSNYDLFVASSGLLTDYSSIFVDYLMTNKPMAFLLNDWDQYSSKRGFTLDGFTEYLPGELLWDKDSFLDYLFHFENETISDDQRKSAKDLFLGAVEDCSLKCAETVIKL